MHPYIRQSLVRNPNLYYTFDKNVTRLEVFWNKKIRDVKTNESKEFYRRKLSEAVVRLATKLYPGASYLDVVQLAVALGYEGYSELHRSLEME